MKQNIIRRLKKLASELKITYHARFGANQHMLTVEVDYNDEFAGTYVDVSTLEDDIDPNMAIYQPSNHTYIRISKLIADPQKRFRVEFSLDEILFLHNSLQNHFPDEYEPKRTYLGSKPEVYITLQHPTDNEEDWIF